MNSFEPNHAAEPPVSRMSVPVWPSHRPRKPVVRMTVLRTSMGPGSLVTWETCGVAPLNCAAGMGETEGGGAASIWTCILHFTSSMGVLKIECSLVPHQEFSEEKRENRRTGQNS